MDICVCTKAKLADRGIKPKNIHTKGGRSWMYNYVYTCAYMVSLREVLTYYRNHSSHLRRTFQCWMSGKIGHGFPHPQNGSSHNALGHGCSEWRSDIRFLRFLNDGLTLTTIPSSPVHYHYCQYWRCYCDNYDRDGLPQSCLDFSHEIYRPPK